MPLTTTCKLIVAFQMDVVKQGSCLGVGSRLDACALVLDHLGMVFIVLDIKRFTLVCSNIFVRGLDLFKCASVGLGMGSAQ